MSESGKIKPVIKKSYEVAYALCRIAAKVPEKPFAEALTSEAIRVLGSAAEEEYGKTEKTLAAAEYFIKLGVGVGSIDFANGEVILDEMAVLNEMVAGLLNVPRIKPADLSGIFTPVDISTSSSISSFAKPANSTSGHSIIPAIESGNPAIVPR